MKKVFHDAHRWEKRWYRKLGSTGRDIWNFILDKTEHGIWEEDLEAVEFGLGYQVTLEKILEIFGKRILSIGDGKWFIPDAVIFQNGRLSDACQPHKPIIARLKQLGVYDLYVKEYEKSSRTLKDKDTEEGKDKSILGKGIGENQKPLTSGVEINSAEDLRNSIPIITAEKWAKQYPDPKWRNEQIDRCFDFHTADPVTRPRTQGQWLKKLHSWFGNSWKDKSSSSDLASVDLEEGA